MLDENRRLSYYTLSAEIETADVPYVHKGDTMTKRQLSLSDDLSLIRLISEHYPTLSDLHYFLQSRETHPSGLIILRWKFHHDRILYIGWDGLFLSVRQKLRQQDTETGLTFPVIWRWDEKQETIRFNENGVVRKCGSEAHALWHYATGYNGGQYKQS